MDITKAKQILGVTSENLTLVEIKTTFRSLAKKWHPDRFSNYFEQKIAAEKFVEIREAYLYLLQSQFQTTEDKTENVNGPAADSGLIPDNEDYTFSSFVKWVNSAKEGEKDSWFNFDPSAMFKWIFRATGLILLIWMVIRVRSFEDLSLFIFGVILVGGLYIAGFCLGLFALILTFMAIIALHKKIIDFILLVTKIDLRPSILKKQLGYLIFTCTYNAIWIFILTLFTSHFVFSEYSYGFSDGGKWFPILFVLLALFLLISSLFEIGAFIRGVKLSRLLDKKLLSEFSPHQ